MSEALINPQILGWARKRAALSVDQLADKLKTRVERVISWEEGRDRPTFKQAEKIAKQVRIPFGYLFLPHPPKEELPIPDLRAYGGLLRNRLSADFFDLIQDVQFQLGWYRDYRLEHGTEPLPFVGKFNLNHSIQTIAEDIRNTLGMNALERGRNWEDYLKLLFDRCEKEGIWVMRSGYVGSSTKRTLNVHEFRGFAICDDIAPLVFINGRDAQTAQAFTLAHELAHIWLGKSGISNIQLSDTEDRDSLHVEQICNAVAAETLVPEVVFLARWRDDQSLDANTLNLTQELRVSCVVIARRAFNLGKIGYEEYQSFYALEQKKWQRDTGQSGGNYYATAPIKNGRYFTKAVLSSAMSGALLLRDAGGLLHMKPTTVQKLYNQQR